MRRQRKSTSATDRRWEEQQRQQHYQKICDWANPVIDTFQEALSDVEHSHPEITRA
jgi:hypothetical protein